MSYTYFPVNHPSGRTDTRYTIEERPTQSRLKFNDSLIEEHHEISRLYCVAQKHCTDRQKNRRCTTEYNY